MEFTNEYGTWEYDDKGTIRRFRPKSGAITDVKIPSEINGIRIVAIGENAFKCTDYNINLNSLVRIVIPEGVESIGDWAFSGCHSLTDIVIPEGVKSIGFAAFYCCRSLSDIVIPKGVESIGKWVFMNCWSLKQVKLPDSIKKIGRTAFSNCWSLKRVEIPGGVTRIKNKMFYGCSSLEEIEFREGVKEIGDVFDECSSLSTVFIPASVEAMSDHLFSDCCKLDFICIANKNQIEIIKQSLIKSSVGRYSENCIGRPIMHMPIIIGLQSLERVAVVTSKLELEQLNESSFTAKIRKGGPNIGYVYDAGVIKRFVSSDGVTKIKIPSKIDGVKITEIGHFAFSDRNLLSKVVIPPSVEFIRDGAFKGCSSLSKIVLPPNVKFIGEKIFQGCGSLDTIVISNLSEDYIASLKKALISSGFSDVDYPLEISIEFRPYRVEIEDATDLGNLSPDSFKTNLRTSVNREQDEPVPHTEREEEHYSIL